MISKIGINTEKDRLILAYNRQLVYLNASLLLGTTGVLSLIISALINKEFAIYGLVIATIITLIVYLWHRQIDNKLKKISNNLKEPLQNP